VNAGLDRTVCASSPSVQLAGLVGGGGASGTWSGGTGSFVPGPTALNATYTPSAAEIAAGGVTLTLTTDDPAGPCGAVSDQVRITINALAVVDAGPDQGVCASSPRVQLAGSVSGGASSGTWSGGAGTFSPNASALNATYTPTAAEIAAGSVALTLTSTASGPCPQVSDRMLVLINPAATVSAGPDQFMCATTSLRNGWARSQAEQLARAVFVDRRIRLDGNGLVNRPEDGFGRAVTQLPGDVRAEHADAAVVLIRTLLRSPRDQRVLATFPQPELAIAQHAVDTRCPRAPLRG